MPVTLNFHVRGKTLTEITTAMDKRFEDFAPGRDWSNADVQIFEAEVVRTAAGHEIIWEYEAHVTAQL